MQRRTQAWQEDRNTNRASYHLLPGLTPAERDHQGATHEAAHAVVAVALGIPVLRAQIGERTAELVAVGSAPVGGMITCDAHALPVPDPLAMVWAGQQAGLRWLREHGHDSLANRVDIRHSGWYDTAAAEALIRDLQLEDCVVQDLADRLLDAHTPVISAVAERLCRERVLDGATIHQIIDVDSARRRASCPGRPAASQRRTAAYGGGTDFHSPSGESPPPSAANASGARRVVPATPARQGGQAAAQPRLRAAGQRPHLVGDLPTLRGCAAAGGHPQGRYAHDPSSP